MKFKSKKLIGFVASLALFASLALPAVAAADPSDEHVPTFSLENGNLDGWDYIVNAVDSSKTYFTLSSEKAFGGSNYSLKGVDPSSTDAVALHSPLVEIIPGESYKGSAQMWNPQDGRASLIIRYFDADKKLVGSDQLVAHQQTKGSWVYTEVDGKVAPPTAKYIAIAASVSQLWTTSGTYYDDFKLYGNFPEAPAAGVYSFSGEDFVNVDKTYELTLKASNNADLYSIIADVEYDRNYLEFVKAEGAGAFSDAILTVDSETPGQVSVVATLKGAEGVSEDTDLITFSFMPTVTGSANITLLDTTITAKVSGDTTGKTFSPESNVVHTVLIIESNFDVNKDGEVNLIDLTSVAYYVGTDATTETSKYDINNDGKIDIVDVGVIANIILNQ